jgi:hypothetical protein
VVNIDWDGGGGAARRGRGGLAAGGGVQRWIVARTQFSQRKTVTPEPCSRKVRWREPQCGQTGSGCEGDDMGS